jgi:hypothetical protein
MSNGPSGSRKDSTMNQSLAQQTLHDVSSHGIDTTKLWEQCQHSTATHAARRNPGGRSGARVHLSPAMSYTSTKPSRATAPGAATWPLTADVLTTAITLSPPTPVNATRTAMPSPTDPLGKGGDASATHPPAPPRLSRQNVSSTAWPATT